MRTSTTRKMTRRRKVSNCPGCGAPARSSPCDYCGRAGGGDVAIQGTSMAFDGHQWLSNYFTTRAIFGLGEERAMFDELMRA